MLTDTKLKIAVVDDMEQDRVQIADMAKCILCNAKISHSIDRYADGKSLLDDLRSGKKYNLLLLDVLMDEMDGMALAAELRKQGDQTMIVFISVSQEMARQGYKVKARRYLTKPLDAEELKEALLHCHSQWQAKKEILLPTNQGQYRIPFSDIQFVEAFDRGTRFVLKSETVEAKIKFSEVERMLPKSTFVCCHRGYIVNMAQTRRISPYEFLMKSGVTVPISRLRYQEINRLFIQFFMD